jgi:hypothetical protein
MTNTSTTTKAPKATKGSTKQKSVINSGNLESHGSLNVESSKRKYDILGEIYENKHFKIRAYHEKGYVQILAMSNPGLELFEESVNEFRAMRNLGEMPDANTDAEASKAWAKTCFATKRKTPQGNSKAEFEMAKMSQEQVETTWQNLLDWALSNRNI